VTLGNDINVDALVHAWERWASVQAMSNPVGYLYLRKQIASVNGMSRTKASPETERAGLCEFLDMQREALIEKLQGLSDDQARMAATSSSLSLLSLIKHSAIWERRWFQVIVAGRSFSDEWPEVPTEGVDPTFRLTDEDTVETVVADYREQIAVSREIVGSLDLDTPCACRRWPVRICGGSRCT
jgi:hypothetical protein